MALIVEDGTIVVDADSYVTLADYTAYADARGWTLEGDSEVHLRRAFDGINRNWVYIGEPSDADQFGAFPRDAATVIPRQVKDAQCELAYLVQSGLDLFATIDSSTTSESIKVGPITISEDTLPIGKARVVAVETLLRPFLAAGSGQARLVRS